MNEYILAVIAVAPSLATLVYTIVKDKRQNKSALSRSIGFLLLRALKRDASDAIQRGSISPDELEILEESYALYHELGGNGFADSLMVQARKLPMGGNKDEK